MRNILRFFGKKEEEEIERGKFKSRLNPPKVVFLSFLTAILVGSVILSLPIATPAGEKSLHYIDALFTATSATCVTGLIVKKTGEDFSLFGQVIILVLIQIGGLGIMTLSTFFLSLFGRKMTLRDRLAVQTILGREKFGRITGLIRHVLLFTFTFELIGAAILYLGMINSPANTNAPLKTAYFAVFHSISAFCNSGFSLYSDSLIRYNSTPIIVLTMGVLIICGGFGFLVLYNIRNIRFWKKDRIERGRLGLQSKVVLTTTAFLIAVGFLLFLIFEWNRAQAGFSPGKRIMNSFFCAVTPRTAGFNTVDYTQMSKPGLLLSMFLMFIGASPGSTGGGIKTCTFAILLGASIANIRGESNVSLFKRTLPTKIIQEAIGIVSISILIIVIMTIALSISEQNNRFENPETGFITKTAFEVISAFGTVGLSTGITSKLTQVGRLLITVTMFVGRIGPLVIALAIGGREMKPPVLYPEEPIMIG